jgi:hypothetical protein
VPGFILLIWEVARQLVSKLEIAKTAKANLKYGQGMTLKQAKIRNQFLGPCWNMPYCRETVRSKCPVFLGKRGPCWRNKRGCMCDETIVLNAASGNWKETVASTVTVLEGRKSKASQAISAQQGLSSEFKRERCRQCVIYNTHQEQKYKALVAVTFGAAAAFFVLGSGQLISLTEQGYDWFDSVLGRFSFNGSTGPTANAMQQVHLDAPVAWVLLTLVSIIVLSKVLQFVEYCCFKIKI